jgi:hypothetical protein
MKKTYTVSTTIGSQWWHRRIRRILARAELNGLRAMRDYNADDKPRGQKQLSIAYDMLRADLERLTQEVFDR